ncbi:hypothetical protein [Actinomadura sp. 21ATH]|uniref:hypothetical protein n=1 Tax=Actinomadura sp. 21ATH TaxID=1735444 RepID=UPI0035BF3D63
MGLRDLRRDLRARVDGEVRFGYGTDRGILEKAGVRAGVLDVGRCGLAGDFGFERGHYDISAGAAELGLRPAVRGADEGTRILAGGFSCRTRIETGTSARPVHMAEVLLDA